MKNIIVLAFALISFNSFAVSIEEAVKKVEVERNAQCTFTRSSTLQKCFGYNQTCFYTVNYKCVTNEETFGLKLRIMDLYNYETNSYTAKVRKTIIVK